MRDFTTSEDCIPPTVPPNFGRHGKPRVPNPNFSTFFLWIRWSSPLHKIPCGQCSTRHGRTLAVYRTPVLYPVQHGLPRCPLSTSLSSIFSLQELASQDSDTDLALSDFLPVGYAIGTISPFRVTDHCFVLLILYGTTLALLRSLKASPIYRG
jgi:hypothetical protein